jgi:HEAT repeat protein
MNETLSFQKVLDALLEDKKEFPRRYLHEFSDIPPLELKTLLEVWPRVNPSRKRLLLEQLESLAESDTLVSFEDLARALLTDPEAIVRTYAIRLLNECEDPKLITTYINILQHDEDLNTRAEAAKILGNYVLMGELEEIPVKTYHVVEDALLAFVNGKDQAFVRRYALESLGYSSRPEVTTLIESSFARQDPDWQASALSAMGHSNDERWQEQIIPMLLSDEPIVQLAAVKAAGELGLTAARSILIQLLLDEEADDDLVAAGVWSLSQIGGEEARVYIESLLDETENENLITFLEEALDNLAFTEDLDRFDLLALDTDEYIEEELEEDDDE